MQPSAAASQEAQHSDPWPGRVQVALLGGAGRGKALWLVVGEGRGGEKAETVSEVLLKEQRKLRMDQRTRLQGNFSEEVQGAESGP